MDLHWNYAGHFAKSEKDPNYADLLTPRYYGLTLCVTQRISLDEILGVLPAEFNWSSADGLAFRGEEGHWVIDVLRLTDRTMQL